MLIAYSELVVLCGTCQNFLLLFTVYEHSKVYCELISVIFREGVGLFGLTRRCAAL